MKIKAEYIWIDGLTPTAKLRSKTKIMEQGTEPPIWGFDGSSTQQATGDQSDCVLKPVAQFPDPIRGGDNILVMCEVMNVDMTPMHLNTRAALVNQLQILVSLNHGLVWNKSTHFMSSLMTLSNMDNLLVFHHQAIRSSRRLLLRSWCRRGLWT
ncbi:MAG: hypothetical protein Ct9H90mP10_10700 [Actinomycetota bacterium]|nr:MAG: hypothetical protein Ct9H90mP10_10700 [Actinomycetota bacterium]